MIILSWTNFADKGRDKGGRAELRQRQRNSFVQPIFAAPEGEPICRHRSPSFRFRSPTGVRNHHMWQMHTSGPAAIQNTEAREGKRLRQLITSGGEMGRSGCGTAVSVCPSVGVGLFHYFFFRNELTTAIEVARECSLPSYW